MKVLVQENKGTNHWPTIVTAFVLLLQFVALPGLGDLLYAGRLYPFAFAVLGCGLWLSWRRTELAVSPVVTVFAILVLVFFASVGQAREPFWALLQVAILGVGILFLVLLTDMSARAPEFADRFVDGLMLSGVVAAGLGLYEYIYFLSCGVTRTPLIPYLLPSTISVRIAGTYGQSNQCALFLLIALLAFFYRYVHGPAGNQRSCLEKFRLLPFFLVAFAFFLTLSRSGLLALCLAIGFLAWLVASRRYLAGNAAGRREFLLLLVTLGAAFLVLKGLAWNSAPELGMARALGDKGTSASGRFVFWTSAWLIFIDHPWFGIGLDHYKFFMNGYGPLSHKLLGFVPYQAMKSSHWTHNELLQILCEGGVIAFALSLFLLGLFLFKFWRHFVRARSVASPFFLYSHLLILPFIIQAMFEWPLRSPPLLILFFACLALLLAQYPLVRMRVLPGGRFVLQILLAACLILAVWLLVQECRLGAFKREFARERASVSTLPAFVSLAEHPYSSYRVMRGALPVYLRLGLASDDDQLLQRILPYYERLSALEGARWQWYDLARLYLKLGREGDSRRAIQRAIDLMPLEPKAEFFLHYLNMLQAARATGRPLDSFWPHGQKVDFRKLELVND